MFEQQEENIEKSELELAIENRERKCIEFNVPNILGGQKVPLGKLRIRLATEAEQTKAASRAYEKYLKSDIKHDGNSDILENMKTCHILHSVCLDINSELPAFKAGPDWMSNNLGVDEIGILLANYNEVQRKFNPSKPEFDIDSLKQFSAYCSANSESRQPNRFIEQMPREGLAEIAERIAILYDLESKDNIKTMEQLRQANEEIDKLNDELAKLKAKSKKA